MTMLEVLPAAIIALPALSLAVGLDLYLTLLVIGIAPHTGLWDAALPGALGDLKSPWVLLVVGAFYVAELTAERWASSALIWNGFHGVIRPLAGGLLALLLLEGEPLRMQAVGVLLASLMASLAHSVRTGARILLWLRGAESPNRWLLSIIEDVVVVALVVMALDLPTPSALAALVVLMVGIARARSDVGAFIFAVRLGIGRLWGSLGHARWTQPVDFPSWVRRKLAGDIMAPGGGLRGCPAAAHGLPGAPRFTTGWIVVRGDTPLFVFRGKASIDRVDLGGLGTSAIVAESLFRRVDFAAPEKGTACVYLGLDGPGVEALEAEFQLR